jgi:hypothetical protein
VSSGSTSSSFEGREGDANAAQQSSHDQQQQPPADWLLDGLYAAQSAQQKALPPLEVALAPYLEPGGEPPSVTSSQCLLSLPAVMVAAGEALCAAVPSSSCCSNPRCTNLHGVSAGFALVRGKGCVCAGCLGLLAGQAAAEPLQGVTVAARCDICMVS